MCDCQSCECQSITLTTRGEKGERGEPGTSTTQEVIIANTGTLALTHVNTGGVVVLDRAAGVSVTLPTDPVVDDFFDFTVRTDVTSNGYIIETGGSSDKFNGFLVGKKNATADSIFKANAALTDDTITMNGTTTGGLIGTSFRVSYVSTNQWLVDGQFYSTGVTATPFS